MDVFTALSITTLVLLISSIVLRHHLPGIRFWHRSTCHLPPGSLGWPLLGETIEFISSAYSEKPECFVDKRRNQYGKLFKSHIFGSATIVSTDADISKFILQSDPRTMVPAYPKSLMELMGKSSILVINGSLQRRVHGLIGSFLKSETLKSQMTKDMQKYLLASMDNWKEDRVVFVQDEAKHVSFQLLVKALISLEPGKELEYLKKQFQVFISGLMSLPINLPGTQLRRSLKAKKRMAELILCIIHDKRETGISTFPRDVVDVLLKDARDQLTDELISANMIDFMIPGEDSVPVLITLAIKYLSECHAALQQLTGENMELKKLKDQLREPLSFTDYFSLSFTQMVISETLRLGNIIVGVMRKSTRDLEIKGYLIPKGWCIFTYFRSVHLDQDLYDSPYEFNPWRWQNRDINGCSFTPFGGGQRLCPGIDLARLETCIFLHHFVTRFRWEAEEDSVINFPTVRTRRGMPVWIKRIHDLGGNQHSTIHH